MSKYKHLTDNMTWSYSRAGTFNQCRHAWYLSYIDKKERKGNFFSDFGLIIHEFLEAWWDGRIDTGELAYEYTQQFDAGIKNKPPAFMTTVRESYYDAGLKFFKEFNWIRDDWELLGNETTVNCEHDGIKLTVRPDLIIRNRETDITYLCDYKNVKSPFKKNGEIKKGDVEKIEGYWKQLSLYAHFIEKELGIKIDVLRIFFPKAGIDVILDMDYNEEVATQTLAWWAESISSAKAEEEFPTKEKPDFFCDNICSVRNDCKLIKEQEDV